MPERRALLHSPFIPPEWIAAHGFRPARVLATGGPRAEHVLGEGVCPHARRFLEYADGAPETDMVVMSADCDQTRRLAEFFRASERGRLFLMHTPRTWETAGAQKYYRDELIRLGDWLVERGGVRPTSASLIEAMRSFDARRRRLLELRPCLRSRDFAEELIRLFAGEEENWARLESLAVPTPPRGVRAVALVGGPPPADILELHERLEAAGARVELDAGDFGERALPRAFDRRRLLEDPFDELADAYFGAIPDIFRRPNSLLYQWLGQRLAERSVRAVLFHHYLWCDLWRAELERMREWLEIPMLAIECGDETSPTAGTLTRLDAFLEALR